MLRKAKTYFSNVIDPYIPEWWAQETLAILYENMVAAKMVNRDFEPYFNKYGDTVNTRRPREFTGVRKVKGDPVTTQDAIADNIAIKLDQWCHVSFIIDDLEATMSMKKLQDEYAVPAGKALARMVDRIVLGQYPRFLPNVAGSLNGITEDNMKDYVLDLRKVMDQNKAYDEGRNVVLTPKTEADLLRPQWFTSAEKVGDNGTALRTASLGEKFGLYFYKDLNMANVPVGNTVVTTFVVNNAAGYAAGTTTLTVGTGTGIIATGSWISLDGVPYQISAHTETTGNTTSITLSYGLVYPAANGDKLTVYTPGAVNNSGGYPAGWNKEIAINSFTVAPQVGQLVSFNTDTTNIYTVIAVDGLVGVTLDRSLAAAISNGDAVNIGPAGAYNLAFHRDAMTLAIRGLAPVISNAGAISTTMNDGAMSVRVTISYDAVYQRHRWTLDFLAGIQLLNKQLGAILLG